MLGKWDDAWRSLLASTFGDAFVFPLGAVLKALEWWKARPTDDHTRTGLNAATDLSQLRHRVTSYEDLAAWLKMGHHACIGRTRPSQLPFAPWLWLMLHRREVQGRMMLSPELDFGTRACPAFSRSFRGCSLQMARSELLLTRPMVVHADDTMHRIVVGAVRREMAALQEWSKDLASFKR